MAILRLIRHSTVLLLILICLGSLPIRCQVNVVQDKLNSVYKGKIFLLRNFYTGNDLEYGQNGELLSGEATQGPWTLAGIKIARVKITPQGAEIVGDRLGFLYRNGKADFVMIGQLKIHVVKPVSNVDTNEALEPVFSKIFMKPNDEDPRPIVPLYWRSYLSGTDSKSRMAAWKLTVGEDKMPTFGPADATAGKLTPPRAASSPDPKYGKEAEAHHVEGRSVLAVVVDATGKPVDIAIIQPLGMGLDEQAVLAVSQWKFRPATLNGEPVRVPINVAVDFRCCPTAP